MKWDLSVTWMMAGTVTVEADTIQEAAQQWEDSGALPDGAYIDDSGRVDWDQTCEALAEDDIQSCITSGKHLQSCDGDGYCNFCGEQQTAEEFAREEQRLNEEDKRRGIE